MTSAPTQSRLGRVLFVDGDGVFHPAQRGDASTETSEARFGWVPFLDQALQGHDDVVIVAHSTWRYEYTAEELRELFGVLGRRVVATTPRRPRHDSIKWWLEMNGAFTDYRVVDDDPRELPDSPPRQLILFEPGVELQHQPFLRHSRGGWRSQGATSSEGRLDDARTTG